MTGLQAIVLGLLQGATEFIPVSSSGHLVLVPWLLGWPEPGLTYDLLVHLGTLVAVLIHFRLDILGLALGVLRWLGGMGTSSESRRALLIIVSAIPGAILGYFLQDLFEGLLGSPRTVSLLLAVTGSLLVIGEHLGRRKVPLEQMRAKDALIMGAAQGCAIAPGISRSGATIAAGLLCGLDRKAATQFSFLMSLPIILGASGYGLLKAIKGAPSEVSGWPLVLGFSSAAVSGYVAMRFLLDYVRTRTLRPFAYYCFGIAGLAFVLSFVR